MNPGRVHHKGRFCISVMKKVYPAEFKMRCPYEYITRGFEDNDWEDLGLLLFFP